MTRAKNDLLGFGLFEDELLRGFREVQCEGRPHRLQQGGSRASVRGLSWGANGQGADLALAGGKVVETTQTSMLSSTSGSSRVA